MELQILEFLFDFNILQDVKKEIENDESILAYFHMIRHSHLGVKRVHFREKIFLLTKYATINLWINFNIILQKKKCSGALKMFPNILDGIKLIKN